MRADELRSAVVRVTEILKEADLAGAINALRAAKGDARAGAATRLRLLGTQVGKRFQALNAPEKLVVKQLHLTSLASAAYWEELHAASSTSERVHPEVVRLASRVMFATNHLPALTQLLADVPTAAVAASAPVAAALPTLAQDEDLLIARLSDAGERAADPDRIARAIDGIDMLYSACASVARKPTTDLRLERIDGAETRDIHFVGETDTVASVGAVLASIPGVIAGFDQSQELDLDELVAALPVFEDLRTLGKRGSFTSNDLKDIKETMYQGAMLSLESGITIVPAAQAASAQTDSATGAAQNLAETAAGASNSETDAAEHYDRYLQEREAMQQATTSANAAPSLHERSKPLPVAGQDFELPAQPSSAASAPKTNSVEGLLQALGKGRDDA